MSYETLDVYADAGGDISPVSRATETTYADGYTQVVFNGRQRVYDKVSFTYSGDREETTRVYELLYRSMYNNVPFYHRFANDTTAKLYKLEKDSLRNAHIGGLKWQITATFVEWNGLP